MLLINEKDMEWVPGKAAHLDLKNIVADRNIAAGKLTCGVSRWAYGEAGKIHTHVDTNQDEIYIVLRGKGRVVICGEEHIVGPGDMLHAVCGEEHGMVEGLTEGGIEMFYMLVPTEAK